MSNMRPFSLVPVFGDLERELNKLFHSSFDFSNNENNGWNPRIDILEEDKQFIVHVDVPGVDPKDISIHLDHNNLVIKGEKEIENHERKDKDKYIRNERLKGIFYRSISLPEVVDGDKITAKSKNGVITINIPKSEKNVSRKIQVIV